MIMMTYFSNISTRLLLLVVLISSKNTSTSASFATSSKTVISPTRFFCPQKHHLTSCNKFHRELILQIKRGGNIDRNTPKARHDEKRINAISRGGKALKQTPHDNHNFDSSANKNINGSEVSFHRFTTDQNKIIHSLSTIMLILGYQGIIFGWVKILLGLFWIIFQRPYTNYYYTHPVVTTLMNHEKMNFVVRYLKYLLLLFERIEVLSHVDAFIGKLKPTDVLVLMNHIGDVYISKLLKDGGLAFRSILHKNKKALQKLEEQQQQEGGNNNDDVSVDDINHLFEGLHNFDVILREIKTPVFIKLFAVVMCIFRIMGLRSSIPGLNKMEFAQFYEMF